jgi:hypothetical protein
MSLLEQQNFLARLFTDKNLRQSFWENPSKIGKDNGLSELEISQLNEIVSKDLDFFAESLFHKRLQEVEKLLPLTKKFLDKDFSKVFRGFSQTFQPKSIKKHLEDAIEFCKYLQNVETQYVKDAAKFEQTKHEFFSRQKLVSLCLLKHNIFNLKKKITIAVWYRTGNQTRHFIL